MGGLNKLLRGIVALCLVPVLFVEQSWAWGGDGHRMINRLAAENLPDDVPAFLRDARAQATMEYLGPEPDRWRNPAEPELNAAQAPEHFFNFEYAGVLKELPRRRYDYVRALAFAQKEHPDLPLSVEKVGLQPYVTLEVWERLKAAMREYRGLVATKADTRPAEQAIVFYAAWLGHYVGDGSMPLHTTVQYNGWTGENPNGYTTLHTIHAQFESTFVTAAVKAGDVASLVRERKPRLVGDVWTEFMHYLQDSHALVEKTYALEKAGGFNGEGTAEGRTFAEQRLAAGAIELRDLIYTAWVRSADPAPEYHAPTPAPATDPNNAPSGKPQR